MKNKMLFDKASSLDGLVEKMKKAGESKKFSEQMKELNDMQNYLQDIYNQGYEDGVREGRIILFKQNKN